MILIMNVDGFTVGLNDVISRSRLVLSPAPAPYTTWAHKLASVHILVHSLKSSFVYPTGWQKFLSS